ncbi:MAG: CsbD family protein [Betaproteobacteria bacterium]|jgi:uncharacterized protein YjbJ (UPF0337 family)|nr:MAG: CsbD family protein [Betaproteobacteria bacterium]
MNKDQVKGGLKQATGKAKVVAGKITGDAKTQADGYVRQVAGKIQKAYGNLKDAARKSR